MHRAGVVQGILQRTWEPWRWGAQWPTNWEDHWSWSSYMRSCQNSTLTILQSFSIWSKLESWKRLISGYLFSWPQIKKSILLKSHFLLLYATTTSHFSIGLWHAMKSGLYTTTSDDQLSGWKKKKLQSTPQSQTYTKKGHGHCLEVCCSSDPLQLSESLRNHYLWEVCAADGWDALKTAPPTASTSHQKGPSASPWHARPHTEQPTLQKSNDLGCGVLPHLPYSPDLSPTPYHFFKHLNNFLQGKRFHNQQEAENAFQQFIESKSMDFCAIGINTYFSLAKMGWL